MCDEGLPSAFHLSPHTYDLGLKGLTVTNIDGDIEGSPTLQIAYRTHTYDLGLEGLPSTNSARDIERKPALAIQGRPHKYELGVKGPPLTNINRDVEPEADRPNCTCPAQL